MARRSPGRPSPVSAQFAARLFLVITCISKGPAGMRAQPTVVTLWEPGAPSLSAVPGAQVSTADTSMALWKRMSPTTRSVAHSSTSTPPFVPVRLREGHRPAGRREVPLGVSVSLRRPHLCSACRRHNGSTCTSASTSSPQNSRARFAIACRRCVIADGVTRRCAAWPLWLSPSAVARAF